MTSCDVNKVRFRFKMLLKYRHKSTTNTVLEYEKYLERFEIVNGSERGGTKLSQVPIKSQPLSLIRVQVSKFMFCGTVQ